MSLNSDDITDYVLRSGATVSLEYGRDQSTALAPTVAGRGSLTLKNETRRFSPRNTVSPLYGYIKPARPVIITRTTAGLTIPFTVSLTTVLTGGTYTVFTGHTDDNPINPDVNTKTVSLSLVDSLADFRGFNISTQLYAGIFTGQAIGYILDACGWDGPRDLDRGATVIPWFWADNQDALTVLEEILRSEGPPAMLTIGADGAIVFKDRHHRLLDSASVTSQQSWHNIGVEPVMQGFDYDEAWRNIVNTGTVEVGVRTPTAEDAVWTLDSPIGFAASEAKQFTVQTSDPFLNAVAPVADTDFAVTSGSIASVVLSRTSGASTTITVTAGVGGAQIDRLQLRAQPVQVAYTVQVTASNAASIADYGPRSFPGDLPWCNQYDAQAVLDAAVEMRCQPLPIVQAKFQVAPDGKADLLLGRDLSDRVKVYETETALNGVDFFVESIKHEIASERDHIVEFGLEAVPPDGAANAGNVFILGGGVGHQIGDGVLAR